jgi:hypothetical protein
VRSLTSWVAGGGDAARAPAAPSYDLAGAPKPEPSLAWRPLTDDARRLGALVPSPVGALLAAADGLGRVLVVDGASMVVLRMWKARAARRGAASRAAPAPATKSMPGRPCAACAASAPPLPSSVPLARDPRPTSSQPGPHSPPQGYRDAQCGWALPPEGHPWAHHGALLVLYAPRRDLIEAWAPRSGARVASARAGGPCQLLPVAPPCGGWKNDLMRRWLARGAPSTLVLRLGGRDRGGVWDVLDMAARP